MAAGGNGLHQVAPVAVDGPHLMPGEVRRVHPRLGDGQAARVPRQQCQVALAEGQAMSPEQALAYALEEAPAPA
jgi:hypothetical protein